MRNRNNTETSPDEQSGLGGPQDGVPSLKKVTEALLGEEELEGKKLVRLELNIYPSQDATYRGWTSADEEPIGGYIFLG
jgi:hypothetical protein